jgi:hypothetical protein
MSVLLVRLRPGIDRSALNFLPVAVRERPESSAISAGDCSFWHGAQYPPGGDRQGQTILPCFAMPFLAGPQSRSKNGFGSRDQMETSFPSCASTVCPRSQALTAGDWTAFQSPSGNVLEAPQSPQVSVRSAMGLSIRRYPGFASRSAKPSYRCPRSWHAVIVPQPARLTGCLRHPMPTGTAAALPVPHAAAASITSPAPLTSPGNSASEPETAWRGDSMRRRAGS